MNNVRFAGAGLAVGLLAVAPSLAHAHTGLGITAGGFAHGFAHPLQGADHLLAMIAVGIFAAQRGGRALWVLPATFIGVMVAGFVIGAGNVPLPGVEVAIVASVLILGALVAGAARMPLALAAAVIGAFALFHGHAHGVEMPTGILAVGYGAGFIVATALLHASGVGLVVAATRASVRPLAVERIAGVAIAAIGLVLMLA